MPTCMDPTCWSCNPPQDMFYCDEHEYWYPDDDLCQWCVEETEKEIDDEES